MTNERDRSHGFVSSRCRAWWWTASGLICVVVIGLLCVAPAQSGEAREQQQLVDRSKLTFDAFLSDPKLASWLRTEAKDAKAIFIVPHLLRGALVVGASGGSGVLLARDFVKGGWSPPAFYTMSAGSFGLQAGGDASEVLLVIRTFAGLERFYGGGTFKLGMDSGLSIGPLGEGGVSGLDMVSFAKSKGAFVGLSFSGFAISASSKANEAYYGKAVKPEQILANGPINNSGADALRAAVGRANRTRQRDAE
ncbi:MAG TPA: lipid-binding SYLF domain-containing protein [Nitrospira sp.]|nr:lipid-binding SYLF domain-containing protein [Nitrospira sp.]